MKTSSMGMVVVFWVVFTSAWAAGQTSTNVLDKRYNFYGGIQLYQAEGEFTATQAGRSTTTVDLDDLNLAENALSPIAGALFNFGKRWSLRLDYFGYHDDAKTTADFSFNFEDVTIPAGARADSDLDLDVYVVNLAYNFYHSERARFGVGIGVHVADFKLEISGQATAAGRERSIGSGKLDLLAPLPNLYAYGAYAFTDRLVLRYGGGWMSLSYDDYDGSLYFVNAFLEYWPFQYAGFGAGYRYLAADIEYDPGDKKEEYDIKLPGPLLYVVFGF